MTSNSAPMLHPVDLIRKKRDGEPLTDDEIRFLVAGAAGSSIPLEQLAAWLMAAWIRGLNVDETRALTVAMRDSGEKFDPSRLGKKAVDKHSTGGVGDKTSFLVAPIAAACGVAVPMISGRALGHTGGTLDKLESIPGYRTALSLREFESVLGSCGASIVSQTLKLVPADRVLYSLRDRTSTVENVGLICASILSKKLAAGLHGLVLDVKTGSGAFMRKRADAERLAALMVATAEAAGTRTVALLTDMGQPLGHTAGNWIEVAECVELLRGERPAHSEDLRQLSLILAGWMIHIGGKAPTLEVGSQMAEAALSDGSALGVFIKMVDAHGGDVSVFDDLSAFHKPDVTQVLNAWASGFVADMDTTAIGWAVQRTGAGREGRDTSDVPAESIGWEPVDPHAGIVFHARRGDRVEKGSPIATLYATSQAQMDEAAARLQAAIRIADEPPDAPVPLVSRVFDRKTAEAFLRNPVKVDKTGNREQGPGNRTPHPVAQHRNLFPAPYSLHFKEPRLDRFTGILGILAVLAAAWLGSTDRRRIRWRTVAWGLSLQVLFAFFVLRFTFGQQFMSWAGDVVNRMLSATFAGTRVLFGELGLPNAGAFGKAISPASGSIFAFQVLPTIIFISAFFAVLYHIGVMQIIIRALAWIMLKTMRISGAESMNVAASIFMGQTEAPLTIRPFLSKATRSELMTIMTSGMAHVSGGIMAMYISQGVEAKHLLAAVIMTSPGTILMAKMLVPETEVPATEGRVVMPKDEMHKEENLIGAIARGTIDGGKLAMNVAIMLISFLALVALLDMLLTWAHGGAPWIPPSLGQILGFVFAPVAWLIGVPWHDCGVIGNLLGTRMALNEVIAYISLGAQKGGLSPRSFTIATFALCGFANLGSIGMQIGGIGALVPERRNDLAKLGVRAMLAGTMANLISASIAGMFLG